MISYNSRYNFNSICLKIHELLFKKWLGKEAGAGFMRIEKAITSSKFLIRIGIEIFKEDWGNAEIRFR